MIRELKTFEITCEKCNKTSKVEAASEPRICDFLPVNAWRIVYIPNCGMTNYTATIHLCGECYSLNFFK